METKKQEELCDCPQCRAKRERERLLKEIKQGKSEVSCCAIPKHSSTGCTCGCCEAKRTKKDITLRLIFLSISLVMLILSYINLWKLVGLENIDYLDFGYIAIILCGYPILIGAFRGLKNKKITSNLLVTVAIVASIVLEIICRTTNIEVGGHSHSYVFAAGEVAFLMALGGLIEAWTVKASRKGIERLVNMSPKTANIKVGDSIENVKIDQIKIGDVVLVKPNELIPVDGEVIKGKSAVDQSSVTGEFVPVDVCVGSVVYGATWNKMGVLEIKVTKEPKDMTVNKLINLALDAEEQRAPIARMADKWASWIVPSAILLSLIVGIVSYFAFNLSWMQALIRGVTILVVFCPCSLTLATPTAVAAGIGSGAYNGIIIKSGDALERLAHINAIAFDKTGTITTGNIDVKEVIPFGIDKKSLIFLTASAEMFSEHPIGKAIVNYAKGKVKLEEPVNTRSQVGVGISAKVSNKLVKVVSLKEAKLKHPNDKNLEKLDKYLQKGYTVVVTESNYKIIGALCLYDTIRQDAEITIQKIKQSGLSTVMLTGDNVNSANNIASLCGIDEVKASLMPEDKLTTILDLKQSGKNICMVGDGVNDAPALAAADCSIAMSAIGNDVAVETADVAVMNSDIKNIYNTLRLSKKTLNTIKRNIIISMSINIIAVVLSLFGILTPATGAIVHNVSSVFVVLSSAFILKTKYFKSQPQDKNLNKTKKK